ncbi:MAG: alcohol dehydrogenase catalytic domain-containing protein [Lentisphaerae bacterium]|nr:alcohol dehydrogenase catalytic domain-containing protein [Lentisphaerota bacterium]
MKAAVIKKPGVVVVEDVPQPKPGSGEVLLKVEACALCGTDQRVLSGEKPVDVSIVGHEITGTVTAIGAGVPKIRTGQRFIVQTVIGCGECPMCARHRENLCEKGFRAMGYQFNGGFAEYMVMPKAAVDQGCLITIPADLSAEIGTLIEPLSCCVNGMKYIPLEDSEHVVIFGGGIIGVLNGLVARARGAKRITIMDVSATRLELLKKLALPFDDLVNSSTTDPLTWVKAATGGRGVDAAVVAASVKGLVAVGLNLLRRAGHLSVFAGFPKSDALLSLDVNRIHYYEINVHGANSSSQEEYLQARDFIVSGKIKGEALVTHRFPLNKFNAAVKTQSDPASGSLKIVIIP